ncbi:MAG: L,D-transpeptidase [Anaerolineae bacterium]|nr:L,D-transpeptidase [Anaerolineae bacterium]MDK1118277.1 L,D-transpeptidase [Anaerolineae bacterium]
MRSKLSRREFLKLSSLAFGGMAFSPFQPDSFNFDDSTVVRVATDSVSVYSGPSDENRITGTWFRDELVHVYDEIIANEPKHNPVWYRVWGGYMHRSRLQRVKFLYNNPLEFIPEGKRHLAEVTVPFTQPWRLTKTYGWQPLNMAPNLSTNPPMYYESVHWIDALVEGPNGDPWYRILDDLDGSYYVDATHFRVIQPEEFSPISPEVPKESKRVEINLTSQTLTALEYDKIVFQTKIASGIVGGPTGPNSISTTTPFGDFNVQEKMPAKHMGFSYYGSTKGNLLADADGYVLPGVSWTCFFTEVGHATHGTYWHDNFGAPMSHGCINMRSEDAKWFFRWSHPVFDLAEGKIYKRGLGTPIEIYYA